MTTTPTIGDVKVKSKTPQSLYTGASAEAFIWTAEGWKPLVARITVQDQQLQIAVRVASADLAGLPRPTGTLIVEDPIAGWQGFVSIS